MRIGKPKSPKVRVMVQQVDENGKITKTQTLTVYESTLTQVQKVVEAALTEAAKKSR